MTSVIEYLDLNKKDWKDIDKKIRRHLYVSIPILISIEKKLSDFHWFFHQIKENALLSIINEYKDSITQYKDNLINLLLHTEDIHDFKLDFLIKTEEVLQFLLKNIQNIETLIISNLKSSTNEPKKAEFLDTIKSLWNYLDKTWYSFRTKFIEDIAETLQVDSENLLNLAKDMASKEYNVIDNLSRLKKQLSREVSEIYAEYTQELINKVKDNLRVADGLLPGKAVNGNWHVSIDDCPRAILPKIYTNVTENFAYCKLKDKKCPGFNSSQGSYVSCNQLGMEKTAGAFFREIREADQQLTEQINALSLRDPNIKLLQLEAERRDGVFYYAPILDENLFTLLDIYPKTKIYSSVDYTVYLINNNPLLATKELVVSANKDLLKYIDKGEGMPKIASRPSSVVRLTFTSNARLDPAFRDFMRSLKAVKVTENTWDVPFSQEDEIDHLKNILHDDFGYPIQIFEVVDNPEILLGNYDHYIMACVAKANIVDTVFDFNRPMVQLEKSNVLNKMVDTLLEEKPILADFNKRIQKIKHIANNYKIGAYFVVAKTEEVEETKESIVIQPHVGDRKKLLSGAIIELEENKDDGWIVRDIYTGASFFIKNKDFYVTNVQACKCGPKNDIVIRLTPESLQDLINMFNTNTEQGIYVERPIETGLPIEPDSTKYMNPEEFDTNTGEPLFEINEKPIEEETVDFEEMGLKKGPGLRILVPKLEKDEYV